VHATVIASPGGQNVGKPVIVKWNWSPQTRTQEASIIEVATMRATEADDTWVLGFLHLAGNLHASSAPSKITAAKVAALCRSSSLSSSSIAMTV
jgi:hypothetical protein